MIGVLIGRLSTGCPEGYELFFSSPRNNEHHINVGTALKLFREKLYLF